MNFREKLLDIIHKNNSLLCVGLDVDKNKLPNFLFETEKRPYLVFNKSLIDNTKDLVCAYKLNMAFYEVLGKNDSSLLQKTMEYIPKDVFVILDGKRNDIGNSARKYAEALFESFNADAVTVNPYLGRDSIMPFLEYKDKCSFILCRTSNPSAIDFQDVLVSKIPLYQMIASKIKEWNVYGNCGAVVGATYPNELKTIRNILDGDIPILIPGVGKQGGGVEQAVKNGTNSRGEMALINSSRGIIYAGSSENFAEKARNAAESLRNEINRYR